MFMKYFHLLLCLHRLCVVLYVDDVAPLLPDVPGLPRSHYPGHGRTHLVLLVRVQQSRPHIQAVRIKQLADQVRVYILIVSQGC